jgi:hypothetical protein
MIKHNLAGYYEESLDKLEMYQRLIQYWGFLFDKRNELSVLDNMNFSLQHYPELLKTGEVLAIHDLESGYTVTRRPMAPARSVRSSGASSTCGCRSTVRTGRSSTARCPRRPALDAATARAT